MSFDRRQGSFFIYLIPAAIFADFTVFFISMVIVMGPTPPGTGVMAPAISLAFSKVYIASEDRDHLAGLFALLLSDAVYAYVDYTGTRFDPFRLYETGYARSDDEDVCSFAVVFEVFSAGMHYGDRGVCSFGFWTIIIAIGLPTMFERPTTTTSAPLVSKPERTINS